MPPANISMALPIVKGLQDCADYGITLEPYWDQLRPLSTLVFQHVTDFAALKQLYVDTNPFMTGLAASFFLMPFFLIAGEINQNWSQIDRFWSILPTLYHLHWSLWTHMSGINAERVDLRLIVSTVWSMRLTYNYWRKGGYNIGSEDYRWAIIKKRIGQPAFFVLDILFISSVQNVLLFLVTSPAYISVLVSRLDTVQNTRAIGGLDYFFAGQILYLVAQTWVADQQQWDFHEAKHSYQKTAKVPAKSGYSAEELDRGFCTSGLWAYSRHPNFVSEQLVWWSFYLWSSVQAEKPLNWTIAGPITYSLIFLGSTPITEYISAGKYPEYKEYKQKVGMFFPISASPPKFSGRFSPQKKRITSGNYDASKKNAQDYEQAKKRYDLR